MNCSNTLAVAESSSNPLVHINNLAYLSETVMKCGDLDKGFCKSNKKWCHLVHCEKKGFVKVKLEGVPQSGHKYIVWSRVNNRWRFAPTLNGKTRTIKESHNLDELVIFKDEYLRGLRQ